MTDIRTHILELEADGHTGNLARALEAVLEVHEPMPDHIHMRDRICSHRHCVDDAMDQMEYPCPTAQAVTAALEADHDQ